MLPIEDIFATTVFTPERYDSSTSFYRSFHRRRRHHSTTIEGLKIYEITFPQCRRRRRWFLLFFVFFLSISTQESPIPDGIFVRSAEAGKKWKGERRYLAMSMKVEETFSEPAALLIYSLRRRRRRELVELIPEDFCLESRSRREEERRDPKTMGPWKSAIFIAVLGLIPEMQYTNARL